MCCWSTRPGYCTRIVRLPTAPPGGWTRQLLDQAVRAGRGCEQGDLPALSPIPMRRPWRSPSRCEPATRAAPPTTAQLGRTGAIWIMTCPGRADRPRRPTSRRGTDATTSSRPAAWSATRLNQDGSVEHSMLTGLSRHHPARTPTRLRPRRRLRTWRRLRAPRGLRTPDRPRDGGCVTVAAWPRPVTSGRSLPGVLPTVTATRYVTPLREGGSLPGLMEADDLGTYVVKFRGAGQGRKALIAEVVCAEPRPIARSAGARPRRGRGRSGAGSR